MSVNDLNSYKESLKSFNSLDFFHFIPSDFPIEGFLKAWFQPFNGFEVNWIELEILYNTFSFIPIKSLREKIIKNFPKEQEKHFTTFYRKIKQMITRKLLLEEKDGKDTLIKISEEGAIELGKFYRYNMFKTFSIGQSSWHSRLTKIIRDEVGCLHEKTIISVFNSINILNDYLHYCEKYDEKGKNQANKEKIFLIFENKIQEGKSENEQIQSINLEGPELFLKDGFGDLFISNNLLANLDRKILPLFLSELNRVMKKGSNLFFSEIKEDLMSPMVENLSFFAHLMAISKSRQVWDMKISPYSSDEIKTLFESAFDGVSVQTYGFINLFHAKKY